MSASDVVSIAKAHGCGISDESCSIFPLEDAVVVEVTVKGKHYSVLLPPETAVEIGISFLRIASQLTKRERLEKLLEEMDNSGTHTVIITADKSNSEVWRTCYLRTDSVGNAKKWSSDKQT